MGMRLCVHFQSPVLREGGEDDCANLSSQRVLNEVKRIKS